MGTSINDVDNWVGGGVKIGQNCRRIVLKKLPTWRRGVSKIRKNSRRCLWMVPMQKSCCHANRKNDLKLLHRYMKLQNNKLVFMLGRDRAALFQKCEAKLVINKLWWAISIMQPTIFTSGRVTISRSWKFMTQNSMFTASLMSILALAKCYSK
jgi:hypothetical protein